MRILFLGDSDSQIFGTLPLASAFSRAGHPVVYALDRTESIPPEAIERVSRDFKIDKFRFKSVHRIKGLYNYGAVVVFSAGSRIHGVRMALEAAFAGRQGPRPVLVTGFNGLVYEKFEEGLSWRIGYDLICLNGPRDLHAAESFLHGTDARPGTFVLTGLGHQPAAPPPPAERERPSLVFAEQVIVPNEVDDRVLLVEMLNRIAADNPDWDVVIRARTPAGTKTFHSNGTPLEMLASRIRRRSPNLVVTHRPLPELLAEARLFATVSSTALFEALRAGVPSIVVGDFGIRNHLGSHVFAGSGLVRRLSAIGSLSDFQTPEPKAAWLKWVGYNDASPVNLVKAVEKLRAAGVPPELPPPYYDNDVHSPMPVRLHMRSLLSRADAAASAKDLTTAVRLVEQAMALRSDPIAIAVAAEKMAAKAGAEPGSELHALAVRSVSELTLTHRLRFYARAYIPPRGGPGGGA
jgi:hypothetical protein